MPKIKGTGKILKRKSGYSKEVRRGGYEYVHVYLPSKIVKDSSFSFKDKEEVDIELENGKIIISKKDKLIDLIQSFNNESITLPNLIESKVLENQKKPFIFFKDSIYSYEKTNDNSNRIAHGILNLLNDLTLNRRRINIAVMLPNCPEFIFIWFGIVKTGNIFVPINRFLNGKALEKILNHCDCKILILDYSYLEAFENIQKNLLKIKRVIILNTPKDYQVEKENYELYTDVLTNNTENPGLKIKSSRKMAIVYTEGTTGPPKGVVYKNILVLAGRVFSDLMKKNIKVEEYSKVIYCPTPLFQAFAQLIVVFTMLFLDGSIAISDKFEASSFWDDVRKYNAEIIVYYGGILQSLMKEPPKDIDQYHTAKFAVGGQAPKELWEKFENRFGITIYEGWAPTEAIAFTINALGSKGGKVGSIGVPINGFEVLIIDENGNELPRGPHNIGEIITKSFYPISLEYYKPPDYTPMKIGKDGYVYTGDLGYKDNDGYIYYTGRKVDIIRKGSKNISAHTIESIADAHPLVLESAVFGVSTDKPGEEDIKICVVRVGDGTINHAKFHEYLSKNLAYFMVPRYIEFKKELRRSSERIKKFLLREGWENNIDKNNTWDAKTRSFLDN